MSAETIVLITGGVVLAWALLVVGLYASLLWYVGLNKPGARMPPA